MLKGIAYFITNGGKLYIGVDDNGTIIANTMFRAGLIEAWGRGTIEKILDTENTKKRDLMTGQAEKNIELRII